MTPDDVGRLATEPDSAPRARENVWVEVGWFWGHRSRAKLLLLKKGNVTIPSDLGNVEHYEYTLKPEERDHEIQAFIAGAAPPATTRRWPVDNRVGKSRVGTSTCSRNGPLSRAVIQEHRVSPPEASVTMNASGGATALNRGPVMASDPRASFRYCFGPFELDTLSRRLVRDGEPVAIPDRSVDVLLALVTRPGEVISKDALIEAGWKDVAVTDNSVEQAISVLRRILGRAADAPYIHTVARRGYRFGVPVTRTAPRHSTAAVEAMLAPYRAFVEGRAALETLERDAIERARRVFEDVVRASPDYPSAHVGLAHALALHIEATRGESVFDRDVLEQGLHHAGEACRLDPSSAEAWSVLGLIAHQCRDGARAVAATQCAIGLEPDNWRHHLRLAYVAWGEERLRAARRAWKLFPGVALAHWLAATVYIARGAFAEAEQELVAGAAAQDRQHEGARFRAVGLHLLLGLLRFAQGDESSAVEEFTRELGLADRPHIYTARARANAWCAIAGVRLRQTHVDPAVAALERVLEIVPGHAVAMAARAAITRDAACTAGVERRLGELRAGGATFEAAFAEATFDVLMGQPERAAAILHGALELQPMDSSGWTIPVDPLLQVGTAGGHWDPVLTLLRSRAG